ncbi:rhamnogalacturonan lyase family protein [Nonomuraea muscovyensis]|uniref:rhamnogalacturonan lyase family protein n=1 Tax=Nonomuraea muscovyensis TaxID=1124761 RepID=UPI0035E44AB5
MTGTGHTDEIVPSDPGEEAWASNGAGLRTATGRLISTKTPAIGDAIWWDGDLSREILDHDYCRQADRRADHRQVEPGHAEHGQHAHRVRRLLQQHDQGQPLTPGRHPGRLA